MRFKVLDYKNNGTSTVQTGTCEYCFGTSWQNNDILVVENEEGTAYDVDMHLWDWGDIENFEIDNLVEFSAWLSKQDLSDDPNWVEYAILNAIREYGYEKDDE